GSTTGSLIGLNDLRSLGVPYEGQDSAVAIVDTGVDAKTPNFRGRVAPGFNVFTNGFGNDDSLAATQGNALPGPGLPAGHGTLIAGVVAQFVPQATLEPINVYSPVALLSGGTTADLIYNGLDHLNKNPFVKDPIRPNKVDRIITAAIGIGT